MSGTHCFNDKISHLYELLSRVDLNFQEINVLLDDLNAFHNNDINKINGEVCYQLVSEPVVSFEIENNVIVLIWYK